jgi:hypothetical protein
VKLNTKIVKENLYNVFQITKDLIEETMEYIICKYYEVKKDKETEVNFIINCHLD